MLYNHSSGLIRYFNESIFYILYLQILRFYFVWQNCYNDLKIYSIFLEMCHLKICLDPYILNK